MSCRDGLTVRITKNAVITFNSRFQWLGNAQPISVGRYHEVRLAEAREQVIKLRRVVFDGGGLRHFLNGRSEHALFGHTVLDFLTLRVNYFDLKRSIWILPAEHSKNKTVIRRALSFKVIDPIKSLDLPYW